VPVEGCAAYLDGCASNDPSVSDGPEVLDGFVLRTIVETARERALVMDRSRFRFSD